MKVYLVTADVAPKGEYGAEFHVIGVFRSELTAKLVAEHCLHDGYRSPKIIDMVLGKQYVPKCTYFDFGNEVPTYIGSYYE